MSSNTSAVSAAHIAYVAARTTQEDDLLANLRADARAKGVPEIWIAPEQAAMLQILLRAAGARHVVEVGTLVGYSAISMARALPPGGSVRTIEVNPDYAAIARDWIARSDVADRVEVIDGRGDEVLASLAAGSADAIFLDADKKGYQGYTREAERLLRPGGMLLADNAFAFGELLSDDPQDSDVPVIRAYNDWLAANPAFQSIILPYGDGCWLAVRK